MDTNETREEFLARKSQERRVRVDTKLAGVTPAAEDARSLIFNTPTDVELVEGDGQDFNAFETFKGLEGGWDQPGDFNE